MPLCSKSNIKFRMRLLYEYKEESVLKEYLPAFGLTTVSSTYFNDYMGKKLIALRMKKKSFVMDEKKERKDRFVND